MTVPVSPFRSMIGSTTTIAETTRNATVVTITTGMKT